MKFIVLALPTLLLVSACTISVTTVHTQGKASDVVDEQQSADPQVDADVSVPALGCSGSNRDVGVFQSLEKSILGG